MSFFFICCAIYVRSSLEIPINKMVMLVNIIVIIIVSKSRINPCGIIEVIKNGISEAIGVTIHILHITSLKNALIDILIIPLNIINRAIRHDTDIIIVAIYPN